MRINFKKKLEQLKNNNPIKKTLLSIAFLLITQITIAQDASLKADVLKLISINGGNAQIGSQTDENIRFSGVNIQSNYNGASSELVLNGINGGKIRLGGNLDFATTKLHISSGVDAGLGIANSGYMMIGPSNGENMVFDNNEILARNNGAASTLFLARDGSKVQLGNGAEATGTNSTLTPCLANNPSCCATYIGSVSMMGRTAIFSVTGSAAGTMGAGDPQALRIIPKANTIINNWRKEYI